VRRGRRLIRVRSRAAAVDLAPEVALVVSLPLFVYGVSLCGLAGQAGPPGRDQQEAGHAHEFGQQPPQSVIGGLIQSGALALVHGVFRAAVRLPASRARR
ncbi:MAG TPA: hypothetical protein VE196_00800, partial [Pseudonocardiaceae bacterium]|nr:hypothetical protein [Pseudonocardiaceae bacterium]